MSYFSHKFNEVALKTKGSLSHAFAAAALSTPGQIFMRNAGRISGVSFIGGNLVLGIQYALPAIGFIASNGFLMASDFMGKRSDEILPRLPIGNLARKAIANIAPNGLRFAGIASMMSTGALAYLVRNEPSVAALWISCSTIALQASSYIFEKQFHQLAEKASQAKSRVLSHIFSPIAKYPILTMTMMDNFGKAIMAYGAYKSGNLELLVATGIWSVGGNGGVICKDENVVKWVERKRDAISREP